MARIFISHSTVDKPFVTRLAEDLRNQGAKVWLDDWELRAGDDLTIEIERGISIHEYFVIVISRSALASKWVNRELKWALDREKSNKATLVLPVIIDNTALPDSLSGKKSIDFISDYATQLDELLRVIRFATVKDYPILDRRVTTARRGVPTVKGDLHRIGMFMAGNKACLFFAIVESVGDEQLAPDLTTAIGGTLRKVAENQLKDGTVLTPKDTKSYINLANSVAMYYKVNAKLPITHSLGAKMAVGIQMHDHVAVATVGGTNAMVQTHAEDGGSTIMRFRSDHIIHTEIDKQGVCIDSPVGFANIDKKTVLKYKEFPFTHPTDRIALLSYEVPEDSFQKNLGEAMAKTVNPADVAILLAEFREPAVEDTVCMLLTLNTDPT